MSDVLTITDLEAAKKHDTFHSEVITGKAGGLAAGADIDTATNAVTGQIQTTLPKILRDVGFKPASFNFVTGGTLGLADADKCIYNPAPSGDDNWYSWGGNRPHTVAPGTDPTLPSSGYVPRTDIVLRDELASSLGAGLSGFSHAEAYESGTVGAKLEQVVSITDAPFLGVSGADNTAQLAAASSTAEFIFLPPGVWRTTDAGFAYWKCYGQGTLLVAGEFTEVQPMPQNGATVKVYKKRTFGWRENACAMSTVANAPSGQTKENTLINGALTSYMASTYMSLDHVGVYGAAYNYVASVTTAASTTYTSTSITAPEITETNCYVGMYIRTKHATKYLGKVTSVDYATNTAVVDGWWAWGSGVAGTPSGGTGAEINPNDKIWAVNHNLCLESSGDANKGVGFELGLIVSKSGAGANVWGYDCITLSTEVPYAHFISRGAKTHAFLALAGGTYGFAAEANQVSFESRDPTVAAFRANVGGETKLLINSSGALEGDYRKFKAINQASYSISTDDCFILNVHGSATLILPSGATVGANRVYTIKAFAQCTVSTSSGVIDGSATKSMASGTFNRFICDGNNWYAF